MARKSSKTPKSRKPSKKPSELRRDLVTDEWVVIATGRARRPHAFAKVPRASDHEPKRGCPFEDLQKSGNKRPLLLIRKNGEMIANTTEIPEDWFVQVVPNKFPAFGPGKADIVRHTGPFSVMDGVGFHEIVVTRDHDRTFAHFSVKETRLVLDAYLRRYEALEKEPAVEYVSIFHNWGHESGASIYHSHSQIAAIPVLPADVQRRLLGSEKRFLKHRQCVHCMMLAWERKEKSRIVFENQNFISFCPFVSRAAFEIHIFPKRHESRFVDTDPGERDDLAEVLHVTLRKLWRSLRNPSFNYFIHTAPCGGTYCPPYYHWHIEIIPKTGIWAGFEIATGIEISTIEPRNAAAFLRKH